MRYRDILRAALVALAAITTAACPPVTTKTPVGTTLAAVRDPALTGIWKGHIGDGGESYFTFFPQDDGTTTAVVVTPPGPKDKGGWGAFSLQTVALGRNRYMNVREAIDDGKPATGSLADNSTPLLYRWNGADTLSLYLMDEEAAKQAIKAGKIAGTIGQGQFGDVMLTAPPGELDAFMRSAAARALYTKSLAVLKKMK